MTLLLNNFLDINIISSIIFSGCIGFIGYSIISSNLNSKVISPIDSGVDTIKDSLNSPTINTVSTDSSSIASTIIQQATGFKEQIDFQDRITDLILKGKDVIHNIPSTSQSSPVLHQFSPDQLTQLQNIMNQNEQIVKAL
jgi:hypothetical protein